MNKWYQISIDDIIEKLSSNVNGLTSKDADERLNRYGKNELPKQEKENVFTIVFDDSIVLVCSKLQSLFASNLFTYSTNSEYYRRR